MREASAGTAFIEKLLAPLPANVEQAESHQWLEDLKSIYHRGWWNNDDGYLVVKRAYHSWIGAKPGSAENDRLREEFFRGAIALCLRPICAEYCLGSKNKFIKILKQHQRLIPEIEAQLECDKAFAAKLKQMSAERGIARRAKIAANKAAREAEAKRRIT